MLEQYDLVEEGGMRLADLITGFVDPNALTDTDIDELEKVLSDDEDEVGDIALKDDEEEEESEEESADGLTQMNSVDRKWRVKNLPN